MYLVLIIHRAINPKKLNRIFIFLGLFLKVILNLIDLVNLLVRLEIPILPITATAGANTNNNLTITEAKYTANTT